MSEEAPRYDALLVVSFGGPESPSDVVPFLENVLRGKNVPRRRLLDVAEHYYELGGRSPINDQNRALIAALERELAKRGPALPIYWGNRNWHPLLADTLGKMARDGVRRALAFVTSAFSSYSGCRQYRENIERARDEAGPEAPEVHKLRVFYNHPGFIGPMVERVEDAFALLDARRKKTAELIFTAHSVPLAMAETSRYVEQLEEACRLVAESVGREAWTLVYQSRSGPPEQAWLEPDINDHLAALKRRGAQDVVVAPIGFISDHMEVLYDLDTEAKRTADELGLRMVRAETAGTHPAFIAMIRELIEERQGRAEPRALGRLGPSHDVCPPGCCPRPERPAAPAAAAQS